MRIGRLVEEADVVFGSKAAVKANADRRPVYPEQPT
jgi:hypothetical protein